MGYLGGLQELLGDMREGNYPTLELEVEAIFVQCPVWIIELFEELGFGRERDRRHCSHGPCLAEPGVGATQASRQF